ncbi:MAG: BadF/BadG/BcrA/BcrD ATPase family protein, partial [Thermoprotei archaeon]
MFFVSVDGGATKTVAVCYDSQGHVLGVGVGGPSNFRNVGVEEAKANVVEGVFACLRRAALRIGEVERVTFALAGVKDSAKSTAMVDGFVRELGLNKPYTLLNDGEAGFNCRFFRRDGVIVAAGTGMVAYARVGGVMKRSSGWGWLIGDEGGAFYIGRRALQLAAKLADGRVEEQTRLLEAVERFFSVDDPRRIVDEVYTAPLNIRRIALLAREVSSLARLGDQTAKNLIVEAAHEAALNIIALKKGFPGHNLPVSGYGGVFMAGQPYWETIKRDVDAVYPGTEYLKPLYGYHAVLGSIYMTLEEMGV